MHPNAWTVIQIVVALLCAASAFGVVLTAMLVRGKFPVAHAQAAAYDVAHTDRTYQLATILASIGAIAAFPFSIGTFAGFIAVAVSFQIAESFMLPAMRRAAEAGEDMPYLGTRSRLELLQAAFLAMIFFKTSMPPLLTLASVYGI
jgi:hypothetical protein